MDDFIESSFIGLESQCDSYVSMFGIDFRAGTSINELAILLHNMRTLHKTAPELIEFLKDKIRIHIHSYSSILSEMMNDTDDDERKRVYFYIIYKQLVTSRIYDTGLVDLSIKSINTYGDIIYEKKIDDIYGSRDIRSV